jgi:hypothetical protein
LRLLVLPSSPLLPPVRAASLSSDSAAASATVGAC